MLGQFCRRYPGIDVNLTVANRDQIIERIDANRDDLYIMTQPPSHLDLIHEAFLDNPLVPISALDHPLASTKNLTLADLRSERFIMRESGSGTRIAVEQYLKQLGETLNVRMELGSNEAIKQAVAGGLGLSILSRHTLHKQTLVEDDVAILPVAGFPLHSQWQLVYLRQKHLSRTAQAFLQELKDWTPQYLASRGMAVHRIASAGGSRCQLNRCARFVSARSQPGLSPTLHRAPFHTGIFTRGRCMPWMH